jgi:hypothetical protein
MKAWLQEDLVAHRMMRDESSLVVEKPMVMLQLFFTGAMGSFRRNSMPVTPWIASKIRRCAAF